MPSTDTFSSLELENLLWTICLSHVRLSKCPLNDEAGLRNCQKKDCKLQVHAQAKQLKIEPDAIHAALVT